MSDTNFVIDNPYKDIHDFADFVLPIGIGSGPVFTPRKHPIMTWAGQRRKAKSRKNNLQKHRK